MQDEIDSVKLSIAEMYITPRNVNYGWGDNGVFQFKHNQKSIKKPYAKRKYQPLNYRDSVFELYYTKVQIPDTLYKNLIPKNKRFYTKRIMIILSNDTLYIDKKYNVIKQDKCYQITDAFKNFIIECMPIEIKENWINNLMYGQEGKAIIFDSDDG